MKNYFQKRLARFNVDHHDQIAPYPENALVEITNSCNHKCIFCKNSNQIRRAIKLDIKLFDRFILEAVELGLKEVGLYATGEPFMTKNLHEYIRAAKKNGVKRVYLTTNGALATIDKVKLCAKEGLDSIKFSINAGNSKDYLFVHGHDDFQAVKKNVHDIYEWVSSSDIPLQMLGSCIAIPALPQTHEEHKAIFSKYFDDTFYAVAGSQGGHSYDLELNAGQLQDIFETDRPKEIDNDNEITPCNMLWNRYHLTAEGFLTACCVDYNLNLVFDDLKHSSLAKSWNNQTIKKLRKMHMTGNLEGVICNQCIRNQKRPYKPLTDVNTDLKSPQLLEKEKQELANRIVAAGRL